MLLIIYLFLLRFNTFLGHPLIACIFLSLSVLLGDCYGFIDNLSSPKQLYRKRKKIPKIEKPEDVGHLLIQKLSQIFHFCACMSQNAVKRDTSGKKGWLLCCKCNFDQIKANLAQIQPQNHQNVQQTHFWRKALGVNGLTEQEVCMGEILTDCGYRLNAIRFSHTDQLSFVNKMFVILQTRKI